ncbi:hypothetical protein EXIGLDRAFT_177622 [Exidia glandulosa HHB12029]|uniref:Uncharacterized protein n=1 Tax=Exidia glandulosa HHB12029 TaxID=1314781 RepID=A0A165F4T4_EXIGL|nr:hypothetical protein EXIGLDRAFT_177622 [Exidia glandulosa HHB12029]
MVAAGSASSVPVPLQSSNSFRVRVHRVKDCPENLHASDSAVITASSIRRSSAFRGRSDPTCTKSRDLPTCRPVWAITLLEPRIGTIGLTSCFIVPVIGITQPAELDSRPLILTSSWQSAKPSTQLGGHSQLVLAEPVSSLRLPLVAMRQPWSLPGVEVPMTIRIPGSQAIVFNSAHIQLLDDLQVSQADVPALQYNSLLLIVEPMRLRT